MRNSRNFVVFPTKRIASWCWQMIQSFLTQLNSKHTQTSPMATTATTTTTPPSLTFFSSSVFSERQTFKPFLSFKPPTSLKSPSPKPLSITSELATLPVLSFAGEKVGKTYLELKSAPVETARTVVHHGIITDLQNKRCGTASTLTRGEVRGGGTKPYPQKKTGQGRRGSIRSPLRPDGGAVFGPKPRD